MIIIEIQLRIDFFQNQIFNYTVPIPYKGMMKVETVNFLNGEKLRRLTVDKKAIFEKTKEKIKLKKLVTYYFRIY